MSGAPILSDTRVAVMGVLNLTPDSFSDGGQYLDGEIVDLDRAVDAALAMVDAGADIIDIGGESTRPGSRAVPVSVELARTCPLIEALAKRVDTPLSIDTRKASVASAALDAGAVWVNDVSGLRADPAMAAVVAQRKKGVILGHLRGEPRDMQRGIHFQDVVKEVAAELARCVQLAEAAGVARERIWVDPGIGFGKDLGHNLALLAQVGSLRTQLGVPVMVGPSRKSFLGALTGDPVQERGAATLAACAVAVFAGADAVRVHDVAETRRAVDVARALRDAQAGHA